MTRILLINTYHHGNIGDAAIVLGTVKLLGESGYKLTISTRYPEADATYYTPLGVDVVPELLPFPIRQQRHVFIVSVARLVAVSYGIGVTLLFGMLATAGLRRTAGLVLAHALPRTADLLASYEEVAVCGGGYIYSSKRRLNFSLWHALAQVWLCRSFGKKLTVLPQSVGPLTNRLDLWAVKRAFGSETVVLRESTSFPAGLPIRTTLVPDVAMALAERRSERPPSTQITVIPMDWLWARRQADQVALSNYEAKLAHVIDELQTKHGFEVVIAGHSSIASHDQVDLDSGKRICVQCVTPPRLIELNGVYEAMDLYSLSAVVVGTRLHSALLSLCVGTPTVALAYQPKTVGVLELIEWPFVMDVESFRVDQLVEKILQCVGDREAAAHTGARASAKLSGYYGRA